MKTRKRIKQGRPRKEGTRYPSDQLTHKHRPEREEEIVSIVLAQPHRKAAGSAARDQKAECVFGRLCLAGNITEAQYQAGRSYIEAFLSYARLMGVPLPRFGSMMAERVAGGIDHHEPDDDRVFAARRRFADFEAALSDGLRGSELLEAKGALMKVLLEDQQPGTAALGALRSALNLIDRAMSTGRRHRTA